MTKISSWIKLFGSSSTAETDLHRYGKGQIQGQSKVKKRRCLGFNFNNVHVEVEYGLEVGGGGDLEVREVRSSSIIMYMTSVNARKRQATDA